MTLAIVERARDLCNEIRPRPTEDEDAYPWGSVEIAEILVGEVELLRDLLREEMARADRLAKLAGQNMDEWKRAEARAERLREALECALVGMCAVAVPHKGERETLQAAVDVVKAALKEDR